MNIELELWVARDRCGGLFGYKNEPVKDERFGCYCSTDGEDADFTQFAGELLPEVTYENSPVKMKLIVTL